MSNSYLIICIGSIGLAIFVFGFLIGFVTKHSYHSRLRLNQNRGETVVRNLLVSNFKTSNFHLLNNVTIPFQDGTTQIDQILVSTKGVFVIEVKRFSGWLFGNEKSGKWTQSFYRVNNSFQNPIHQNYRHLKAIQQLLDFLPKERIHSIVVFSGSAEFKTPVPKGVFYHYQLVSHLNSFQDDVISSNHLELCVGRLECKRYELTRATDIQHQAYLAKKFGN